MMKNNLPLWIIGVSLTIILISIPVQQAFANVPAITAFTANDPDDADTVYSNDDIFTLTFSLPINVTGGATMSQAAIDGNFTLSGTADFGTTYAGLWSGDQLTLVITVTDITASDDPIIATTTIVGCTVPAVGCIGHNVDEDNATGPTVSPALGGDFGIDKPDLQTAVWDDPDDNDTVLSAGDTLTLTFDIATNAPGVADQAAIDPIVNVAGLFGTTATYSGVWSVGNTVLTITIGSVGSAASVIGGNVAPGVTSVTNAGGTSEVWANTEVSTGDFGLKTTRGGDDIPPSFVTSFDENEYPISIGDTKFTFAELGLNNSYQM